MDKQRAAELLPIIQAFAEGKTILRKSPGKDYWVKLKGMEIDFDNPGDYEICPESIVLYVNVYGNDRGDVVGYVEAHPTKEDAENNQIYKPLRSAVKMVEAE